MLPLGPAKRSVREPFSRMVPCSLMSTCPRGFRSVLCLHRIDWAGGVENGLLAMKLSKKPRDKQFQRAKREALAALTARPNPPPPPPPWWAVNFGGDLRDGGEDDEMRRGYPLLADRPAALRTKPCPITATPNVPSAQVYGTRGARRGAGDSEEQAPEADEVRTEDVCRHTDATFEEHLCESIAAERGHRGPYGCSSDGWVSWLHATASWAQSEAPAVVPLAADEDTELPTQRDGGEAIKPACGAKRPVSRAAKRPRAENEPRYAGTRHRRLCA